MTTARSALLADVCEISIGQAPKGASYNTCGIGYPLIAGAGDFGDITPQPRKWTDSPTRLSARGDIILCIRATIGDRNWADRAYCLGRGVAGLRPVDGKLDSQYLWYWLKHSAATLQAKGHGATFLQVSKADIASLEIPFPPLMEQKQIAGLLNAVEALRAKRRAALSELDALLQSTFLDMFGTPNQSPISVGPPLSGDPTGFVRLSDYARLATGHTPDREIAAYWDGDIPWISLSDIRELDGKIALKTIRYITEEGLHNSTLVKLPPGTVCLSRTASIGFVTIMGREMATSQDFMNWVCGSQLVPIYLMWAFRMSREYLLSKSLGATHKSIYYRYAGSFYVFLPPLEWQYRFAAIVESIERHKQRLHAHMAELDTLFASLQSKAFTGELCG